MGCILSVLEHCFFADLDLDLILVCLCWGRFDRVLGILALTRRDALREHDQAEPFWVRVGIVLDELLVPFKMSRNSNDPSARPQTGRKS